MTEISTAFATPIFGGTLDTGGTIAGHVTVTTSGTPVQGPDVSGLRGFIVTPYTTNSGYTWIIPHGGSKSTQGYPIGVGVQTFLNVADLNQVDFDCDTNANILCWLKL